MALAFQGGRQVVSVNVDPVVHVANLASLQEVFRAGTVACGSEECGEHVFVGTEVVLAELSGGVSLRLHDRRHGDVGHLPAFLGTGESDLGHAGEDGTLPPMKAARPAVQDCWSYQSVKSAPSRAMLSMLGVL